ncbi:uncharacterized protein C18orf63-like [Apis dorsata]|uniref:uncharacterized protein C18orf63-like n=1 Tax=Apis dorsata TaxID=7462 RepID=UPI001292D7BE|nr:uncharacterized protein C18orf63-like [Apis dorsata]
MDVCNIMYERKEQSILYASFPQINDLCCVICEIDFIEVRDSSAKSNFHWQTMKCRLLIHLISDIIASPVMGTEKFIFVIANKKFFETGKLLKILKNFKLVYQGLRSVTIELYKICLIYTIQTKIAPLWNKVGEYLVQGKDFYNFIQGTRALKLDILIEEKNISIKLHAEIIKIPYIKLEDYFPSSVISQFLADPKGYIDLSQYNPPFVYVLPSTKKGKLLSVSKELPARCVFKDYDQLRRHWKNMYGYSLSKNKNEILFYEIKFLIPKSNIFIYPNMCIASGPLEIIPNKDKKSTITYFLADMLMKLPTVCGKQLQISEYTPFIPKSLNINLSSNVLLKDKKLGTYLKEKENITSQFEFSNKYADGLTKNTNVATSLTTQLTKIHQFNNVQFHENIKIDSINKNAKENQNESQCLNSTQNVKDNYIKNNVLRNSNDHFILSKENTISRYFKIQKTNSCNDMDQDITVEEMAKKNQLDQMKNSDLSDWLKKHSISHNTHGKKTELINKILSHIKNTQILQQYRI